MILLGRITGAHGIRGEVSVEIRTDDPEGRLGVGTSLRTEPASAGPLTVSGAWVHSGRLILSFEGVESRSGAEGLRNVLLVADVDPAERPEDPEEFYDHQLVDLEVRTVAGEHVGRLAEVLHLPGQDVLSVQRPDGTEFLIPFVAAMVPAVDLDAKLVLVDPPPGLLAELPDAAPADPSDPRED